MEAQVLIVGAGFAGICAASELAKNGITSIILEARDRIGGRIWTCEDRAAGRPIELGAEFVHGLPPALLKLMCDYRVASEEVPDRHAFANGGRIEEVQDFWARIEPFLNARPRDAGDASFDDVARQISASDDDAILARSFVEGFHAADSSQMSQLALSHESAEADVIEGYRIRRLKDGYSAFLGAIFAGIPESSCALTLGAPVEEIAWEPGSVLAEAGGKSYRARAAIVTVPPGPLKRIRFSPALIEKRRALDLIASGEVLKIVMRFQGEFLEDFWSRHVLPGVAFVHSAQRFFPTWWSALPSDAPIVTGWTGGPAARELSRLSDDEIRMAALESLGRLFGLSVRSAHEMLSAASFHNWQADPFAEGAYTYLRVGGERAPEILRAPKEETLFFAGEASESGGLGGTVESAVQSGKRVAAEVRSALTGPAGAVA